MITTSGDKMDAGQLPYLMAFNQILGLRPADADRIVSYFRRDAAEAWRNPGKWRDIVGFRSGSWDDILSLHDCIQPDALYADFLASGCSVVCWDDPDYPDLLRQIYDPPLLLFYRGTLPADDDLCLAVIGSRQATPYGRQVAEILSRDLANQGAVIVSGMARGIDGISQTAALDAGGRTVAVLGSGVDVIYPRENAALYQRISEQGAVISEFPLGTEPLRMNFPRRNRIISGLSKGVIVVEAADKSGTMTTVNYALEQGRDVFAVPGSVLSTGSRGTNRLLQRGEAKMTLSAADVWEEYSTLPLKYPPPRKKKPQPEATPGGNPLLGLMKEPVRLEELAAMVPEKSISQLTAELTLLELSGQVRVLPGNYYQTVIRRIPT